MTLWSTTLSAFMILTIMTHLIRWFISYWILLCSWGFSTSIDSLENHLIAFGLYSLHPIQKTTMMPHWVVANFFFMIISYSRGFFWSDTKCSIDNVSFNSLFEIDGSSNFKFLIFTTYRIATQVGMHYLQSTSRLQIVYIR